MKKIIFLAAACAALAACNVSDIEKVNPTVPETKFQKGQKITLTVCAGTDSRTTKVSSELEGVHIALKWQADDKIKVTVGGVPSEFTLKSGAGTNSGTFEGTILGDGDSFEVQYPYNDPDISAQTYSSTEAIPHDMMKFTGSGTTTDFTLTAVNSVLRLNLYGSTAIGSIVVTTNEGTPKTYTLDCKGSGSTGTEPSKTDKPKPFFIVVPAGTYGFTVSVKDVSDMQLYSVSTTTGQDKTFVANEILSMKPLGYPGTDEQSIAITTGEPATTTVWAPVNCGYDATDYPYGLLYQWGRKYGQGYGNHPDLTHDDQSYKDADYPGKTGGNQFLVNSSFPQTSHPDGSTYNGNFYHDSSYTISNWYGGSDPDKLWNSNEGTSDPVSKSGFDPCPEGWRVPTYDELNALYGGNCEPAITEVGGQNGCYFNGTSSASSGVFLPAAGCLDSDDGSASYHGSEGSYWSSSVKGESAWMLYSINDCAEMYDNPRSCGYSVRCVQE